MVSVSILLSIIALSSYGQSATYNDVITKKVKGRVTHYTTQNGQEFTIGDTLTLGVSFRNEKYDYIMQNAGIEYYSLPNMASGSVVVIKKIKIQSKSVIVTTTKPQGFVYSLMVMNFENALVNGEIKSNIMTSDEALAELKKWKDKLNLEIISQEEYNAKKEELVALIN